MKNREKQNKESGQAHIALLAAVVLVAAGTGVWSELHAATVAHKVVGSLTVFGPNTSAGISDNGDGSATVSVNQFGIDDQGNLNFILGGTDPANTNYSQTVNIKPGASGNQTGSGTGTATLTGDLFDLSTFNDTPVIISLAMTVDLTANQVYAFNNHTLNVTAAPVSGQLTVAKVASAGTAAYGPAAGALSILVNGAPDDNEAGIYGQVETFDSHSVTRLR